MSQGAMASEPVMAAARQEVMARRRLIVVELLSRAVPWGPTPLWRAVPPKKMRKRATRGATMNAAVGLALQAMPVRKPAVAARGMWEPALSEMTRSAAASIAVTASSL